MKKLFLYIVPTLLFMGCQDELYNKPLDEFTSNQGIFIENSGIQEFVAEGIETTISGLKVSLVKKENQGNSAQLEFGNQAQLDEYNKEHGSHYIMLPQEMYEVKNNITFDPNYVTVEAPIKLKNFKFSAEGAYALPVRLVGGSTDVIKGQEKSMIILDQKIITKALKINGSGTSDNKMFADDFKVDQWTMEVMVNRRSYASNNRSIGGTTLVANGSTLDEIFTRFGDVTIKPNQLQIKTGASQIDVPSDKLSAQPNTWYMLAFVYDGKKTMVYVNGVLAAEQEIRTGKYGLTGFWIGGANDLIREFRFWKTARTARQIKDNVWKMVNPDSDDLLVYYPMNGKKRNSDTGEIVEDESKVWDWSKNQKHLNMPDKGAFVNEKNNDGFVFPPTLK